MAIPSTLRPSLDQSGLGYAATGELMSHLTNVDAGMAGTALTGAAAGTDMITSKVTGDTQQRFILNADGKIELGSGSATQDTNLYRSAADTWKTDDAVTSAVGFQALSTAVTATSDGLTTGLIPANTGFVTITSGNSAHLATLPTAVVGMVIRGWVGANGFKLVTPATTNATINNVDSDGTNKATIPATTLFMAICVAADTWILTAVDELGAVITAIVPG